MKRAALATLLLLGACSGGADPAAKPGNDAAEIDALARNLSPAADAWRDDTDNQEADTAAEARAAAADNAGAAVPAVTIANRP